MRRLKRVPELYREKGLKATAIIALKSLLAPAVRFGSFYFFECDLRKGLPDVPSVAGITVREATAADLGLLDARVETSHTRREAAARLQQGHRWFVGVETSTGRLANYRWVAWTSAFIPETARELVLRPGEAYVYDLVTLPEYRRRGIDSWTRHWIYSHLRRSCGSDRILAYIHAENVASLAAARRFLTCIGRVWYVCIAGRGLQLWARGEGLPDFRRASRRKNHTASVARTVKPRSDANS